LQNGYAESEIRQAPWNSGRTSTGTSGNTGGVDFAALLRGLG